MAERTLDDGTTEISGGYVAPRVEGSSPCYIVRIPIHNSELRREVLVYMYGLLPDGSVRERSYLERRVYLNLNSIGQREEQWRPQVVGTQGQIKNTWRAVSLVDQEPETANSSDQSEPSTPSIENGEPTVIDKKLIMAIDPVLRYRRS